MGRPSSQTGNRDPEAAGGDAFALLVEHAPIGFFELDPGLRLVRANRRWYEIIGRDPAGAAGHGWIDAIHPDDLQRCADELERARETGDDFLLEHRWLHPDGTVRWTVGALHILRDGDGRVTRIVGTDTDVTRQQEAEAELAALSEHYRRIVELADEGIWTIDEEAVTTYVNRRTAEMLGTSPEAMVGRPVYDFMDPADVEASRRYLASERPAGPDTRTLRLRHADGHVIWTRLSVSPILDPDGRRAGTIALLTDVTEQRAVEEALRYNEARLQTMFEVSPDIIAVIRPDGSWNASPAGTRLLGWPPGFEPEGGALSIVHPDDRPAAETALAEILEGRRAKYEPVRLRLRHEDGRYLWFDATGENLLDDPTVGGVVLILRDVTERKDLEDRARETEALLRATVERSPVGIALIDPHLRIVEANPAFCRLSGRTPDELPGLVVTEVVHPEDRNRVLHELAARIAGDGPPGSPARLLQPGGAVTWVLPDVSVVPSPAGPDYGVVLVTDITQRRALEERLAYEARHDPLTDLANRTHLRDVLERAWAARRDDGSLGVLFVDLDRFKEVNDRFGHEAGDELLTIAARRLRAAVRHGDHIARYGGDEFVVVCEGISGRREALAVADRIRESLAEPFRLSAGRVRIGASVGVAVDHGHATVDELLRDADRAAYLAKDAGRNRVQLAS
jgi:diguanylate cyclase (GGDEF)-like protein/PAS domain S-box-containing protein